MRKGGNAGEISARNRSREKAIRKELKKQLTKTAYRIWETSVRLSSGQVKTVTLAMAPPGLNHPYGIGTSNRRGARGPIPNGGNPGIINEQTGNFKASWDTYEYAGAAYSSITLFNYSPHALAVGGQNLGIPGRNQMIYRPILENIHRIEDPLFVRDMADAYRRALRLHT